MTRRKLFVLGTIGASATAGITLGSVLASARRGPKVRIYKPMTIVIDPPVAEVGALTIRVKASLPVQPFDFVLLWWIDVRRVNTDTGEITSVITREYDQQPLAHPAGRTADVTFTERLEMPAGRYEVLVGLREMRPRWDDAGNVTEPHASIVATTRTLFVR